MTNMKQPRQYVMTFESHYATQKGEMINEDFSSRFFKGEDLKGETLIKALNDAGLTNVSLALPKLKGIDGDDKKILFIKNQLAKTINALAPRLVDFKAEKVDDNEIVLTAVAVASNKTKRYYDVIVTANGVEAKKTEGAPHK